MPSFLYSAQSSRRDDLRRRVLYQRLYPPGELFQLRGLKLARIGNGEIEIHFVHVDENPT